MVLTEFNYFALLAISIVFFFILPKSFRRHVLIAASFLFYAYYAQFFVFIIATETALVYLLVRKSRQNIFFIASIMLPLFVLGFYKYTFLFVAPSYVSWFNYITTNLVIPLGLSFLTFEIIHYAVDTRNGKIKDHNFIDFVSFVMFFPSFAAGPIKRFQSFNIQIASAKLDTNNLFIGSLRIIFGLFKKIVIADSFVPYSAVITNPDVFLGNNPISLWIGIFAFSLHIYFDFSAYSDIAIGSAKLFGITVPENFNNPYMKTNVRDFWRNWHMSLYRWVIDYIFLPLGGNTPSRIKTFRNIFIVFLIIGIWHGGSFNFILWGLYNGLLVSLYHVYNTYLRHGFKDNKFYNSIYVRFISVLATFILISIGWVFFVLTDTNAILLVLKQMAFLGGL